MTRISYGYHGIPGATRESRQRRAVEDARKRFPKASSINATLDPEAPASGAILVEVIVPEEAVAEYYGSDAAESDLSDWRLTANDMLPDLGPETPGYIGIDDLGHPLYEPQTPIAIELLTLEHEQLLASHYDDGKSLGACDGCDRAHAVKVELDHLKGVS